MLPKKHNIVALFYKKSFLYCIKPGTQFLTEVVKIDLHGFFN